MSRLPPFVRKNANARLATATAATPATVAPDCSSNSGCSSSSPPDAGFTAAPAVAAEAAALGDLAQIWQCENPLAANDAAACAHCGRQGADTPVLARQGHAWLHKACWGPMNEARHRDALMAVQAFLGAAP